MIEYETYTGSVSGYYYKAECYRKGNVVTIFLSCGTTQSCYGGVTVCTLPSNFRPPKALMFTCNSHAYKPVEVTISTSGTIVANCIENSLRYTYGTVSYSV